MKRIHSYQMLTTGASLPMTAMATESVGTRWSGLSIYQWLRDRGCDEDGAARIEARRFRYGSYRPSDRAALVAPVEVAADAVVA